MSWNDSFLLRDFNIASPLENSEMGKANIKHTRQILLDLQHMRRPLKIQEAACIFIESSQVILSSHQENMLLCTKKSRMN